MPLRYTVTEDTFVYPEKPDENGRGKAEFSNCSAKSSRILVAKQYVRTAKSRVATCSQGARKYFSFVALQNQTLDLFQLVLTRFNMHEVAELSNVLYFQQKTKERNNSSKFCNF